MNYIEESKLNEIRGKVDIVDLISRYVNLNKRGKNYFGVCPFHDDNEPSLSVSPERQIFRCFSCGASGNVFTFLMDYENMPFLESVKKIGEIAGVSIAIDAKPQDPKKQALYDIYETAQKLYRNNIETKAGAKAKEYLKQRQLDDKIIAHFEIGWALDGQQLKQYLEAKKYSQADMVASGLVNERGYDIFQNRIMFPIHDPNGRLIAYSGRVLEDKSDSKYINTKETAIFRKSEVLYNYHRVRPLMRKKGGSLILLEGYMDVIGLYSYGIERAVATMGTSFTIQQARLIKKLTDQVTILYDGDEAGERATIATIEMLRQVGITPKVIRLEDGYDPEDYIAKYDFDSLQSLLDNPLNMIDFYRLYYKKDKNLRDDTQLAEYINKVLVEINKLDDEVLKNLSLKKLSEETEVETDFLRNQIKRKRTAKQPVKKTKQTENKYSLAEKHLLYYMLRSPEVIKIYRRRISFMPTYEYRLLAIEISEFYEKYQNVNVADIFTLLSGNEKLTNCLKAVMQLELPEEFSMEQIEDYVNVINEYNQKYELTQLKKAMKQEKDINKKITLAEKIRKIQMGDDE